ncbi:MAG: PH domain-containing protein [Bacteroidota bacterium]
MSEFKRQHPIAIVSRVFKVLRANLVPILAIGFLGTRNNQNPYFLYIFLGTVVLALVAGFLGWWRFYYRLIDDEIQIKRGVFVRQQLFLNKERIQVIDITEGFIQRMFGLVQLEIKTAGGGTKTATISAITRDEAITIRNELRKKNASTISQSEESDAAETETVSPLSDEDNVLLRWRLHDNKLMLAAITSGNFGLIASILGATSGQLNEFINKDTIDYVLDVLPGYGNVAAIAYLVLFIVLVSWLFSFMGVLFRFFNFKLEKKENELVITQGLLERKHITVPFKRIQALRFKEGILRQPLGYGMLFAESAGFEQNQQEKSIVVLPFIKKSELQTLLPELFSGFDDPELTLSPPKRAFGRYLRSPNYLLLIFAFGLYWVWDFWWMLFFVMLPFTALGWIRYKDAGIGLSDTFVKVQSRVLAKSTAWVLRKRVMNADIKQGPIQSYKQLATLSVTAASGAQGVHFSVEHMDKRDVEKVYAWVTESVPAEELPTTTTPDPHE